MKELSNNEEFDKKVTGHSFNDTQKNNQIDKEDDSDINEDSEEASYEVQGSDDNEYDINDSSCTSYGENNDSKYNNQTIDGDEEGHTEVEQSESIQPNSECDSQEIGD